MRNYLILGLWLVSGFATAQPNWGWDCTSYEPSSAEIAELVGMAQPQLNAKAEFQAACFKEEFVLTSLAEGEAIKTIYFRFFWPSAKAIRKLDLMEESRCSRIDNGKVSCETLPYHVLRRSPKETILLFGIESAYDLEDLLEFRDRFIEEDYELWRIRQVGSPNRNERIYKLEGGSDEGETRYEVKQRCDAALRCAWDITGPIQIQY